MTAQNCSGADSCVNSVHLPYVSVSRVYHCCVQQSRTAFWVPSARARPPFVPTLVRIESRDEQHSILVRVPQGEPVIAARKPGWSDSPSKALRECHADLRGKTGVAREWWVLFIGSMDEATGLYCISEISFRDNEVYFARLLPQSSTPVEPSGAAAESSALTQYNKLVLVFVGT